MTSKIMKLCKFVCILQILFVHELSALEMFPRGMHFGGNFQLPGDELQNADLPVAEEWFMKSLNNFNPTDAKISPQNYFANGPSFEASAFSVEREGEAYPEHFEALCFQPGLQYHLNGLSTKCAKFLKSLPSQ